MQTSVIRYVPLYHLEDSPNNVRRVAAGKEADEEMEASILAYGLLENLVVEPVDSNPEKFVVTGGRRRLRALRQLSTAALIQPDHPVPCLVIYDTSQSREVSLAENMVRVNLHPADQVEAFVNLVDAGNTVAEIAARFGIAERTVAERLRLGQVAPEILDGYRKGVCGLEHVKAFAVVPDQELQRRVWAEVTTRPWFPISNTLKRILLDKQVSADSNLAVFVGLEAYQEGGGRVTQDLFATEYENGVWLQDPQLLRKLAVTKLEQAAEGFRDEWKWVEVALELPWEIVRGFTRLAPDSPAGGSLWREEDEEEADRLQVRMNELESDESAWSDEAQEEYNRAENRLAELNDLAERQGFTPEQRAVAGCILWVDYDGQVKVEAGLVRLEDAAQAQTVTVGDRSSSGAEEEAAEPARAGYSMALADDLRQVRLRFVQDRLAGSFSEAFDLHLYVMARSVLTQDYYNPALDVSLSGRGQRQFPEEWRQGLTLDWLETAHPVDAFRELREISQADKERLFSACTAALLRGQLSFDLAARPETEEVVRALRIDFPSLYRPTAAGFWQRVTKRQMLAVAAETLGDDWAGQHGKDKKEELAKAMELAFAADADSPEGVTPEGRTAALGWSPSGLAPLERDGLDGQETG